MMDAVLIGSRFGSYLGLMLIFGLSWFATYSRFPVDGAAIWRLRISRGAGWLALISTCSASWAMCVQMCGEVAPAVVAHTAMIVLAQTSIGYAIDARLVVLLLWLGLHRGRRASSRTGSMALAGLAALGLLSLAWAGHGAMDDGWRGDWHLLADMAHLLAAGAWLGAIVGLLLQAIPRKATIAEASVLARAAHGFGSAGTVLVAVLVVTGVSNYLQIIGPSVGGLLASRYGQLLVLKLVLFGAMLGVAGLNRMIWVPHVQRALDSAAVGAAVVALRRSLYLEASLGLAIVAAVAWLGTLAPGP